MNNRLILLAFSLIFVLFEPAAAQAEPKPWVFGWWPWHDDWTEYKKFNPYIEHPKLPQHEQWRTRPWEPSDWIKQRDNDAMNLIRGFYRTQIIYDQDVYRDVPVLVVGPNFYRLSGFDQQRVAETVDTAYAITKKRKNGMFILRDWHTRMPIGTFTRAGLHLQ